MLTWFSVRRRTDEDARDYGIGYKLKQEEWVEWAADRFVLCCKCCKGLVAWVVAGSTKNYEWSATPAMLMVELKNRGVVLRNPPIAIYRRNGIPGSGGNDWLRNDFEWIICGTQKSGKLPWSDNVACGHSPKFGPGGVPSHRRKDGTRSGGARSATNRRSDGSRKNEIYKPPKIANPGNVIDCGAVGGGNIGHELAHETEAPFPEKLVEFFVKSFCPPDGWVLDPFMGSGTTLDVASGLGRNAIGFDIRSSQLNLTLERLKDRIWEDKQKGSVFD